VIVDQPVELVEFLLQRFAQPADAASEAMVDHAAGALIFGGDHLDDLAQASDQFGEQFCHLLGYLP
jgi:hypothetical protein